MEKEPVKSQGSPLVGQQARRGGRRQEAREAPEGRCEIPSVLMIKRVLIHLTVYFTFPSGRGRGGLFQIKTGSAGVVLLFFSYSNRNTALVFIASLRTPQIHTFTFSSKLFMQQVNKGNK